MRVTTVMAVVIGLFIGAGAMMLAEELGSEKIYLKSDSWECVERQYIPTYNTRFCSAWKKK